MSIFNATIAAQEACVIHLLREVDVREQDGAAHPAFRRNVGRHPAFLKHKGKVHLSSEDEVVRNPYAIAWHVVKKQYRKDPSTDKWKKRKRPLTAREISVGPPGMRKLFKRVEKGAKKRMADHEAYLESLAAKEANAATSLGQLFRNQPIPPEWAAWRVLRQQRAINSALGLFEADHTAKECPGDCPYHGMKSRR